MVPGEQLLDSPQCLHNNNNILNLDKSVPLSQEEMAMLAKIEEANRFELNLILILEAFSVHPNLMEAFNTFNDHLLLLVKRI